jgi:hypothetical protein
MWRYLTNETSTNKNLSQNGISGLKMEFGADPFTGIGEDGRILSGEIIDVNEKIL